MRPNRPMSWSRRRYLFPHRKVFVVFCCGLRRSARNRPTQSASTLRVRLSPECCWALPRNSQCVGYTRLVKGNSEFTAVLGWPGYQVYRHAIDEKKKHLTLWVRRKRGNRKLTCPHSGQGVGKIHYGYEREERSLPSFKFLPQLVFE